MSSVRSEQFGKWCPLHNPYYHLRFSACHLSFGNVNEKLNDIIIIKPSRGHKQTKKTKKSNTKQLTHSSESSSRQSPQASLCCPQPELSRPNVFGWELVEVLVLQFWTSLSSFKITIINIIIIDNNIVPSSTSLPSLSSSGRPNVFGWELIEAFCNLQYHDHYPHHNPLF